MSFVIDVSVTMAWCFEDEASEATESMLDQLADEPALVPSLWPLEVANVLLVAERQRRITESTAARFVQLLGDLPIAVDPTSPDIDKVLAAGRRHGLSAYDATYLVLAEREGLALASKDESLQVAARTAGVQLLI